MTRYIIKKDYQATEKNTNYAGEHKVYYRGKNEMTVCLECAYDVKTYGYTTKAALARGLKKAQELADWEMNNGGFWDITISYVEVEV